MSERDRTSLKKGYSVLFHYDEVVICDEGADFVGLEPSQALDLLKWLFERKDELEQMAKEQAE